MTDPVFILCVLGVVIVVAELLTRYTPARHLGATLLVMILAAVLANLGVIAIPQGEKTPFYDGVLNWVTSFAIFWLLLRVNLRDLLQAGRPMIALFLIGSLGTAVGVVLGMWAVDGKVVFGESYRGIGGVFAGTYTGGAVNFNALAMAYGVNKQGVLFGGITVVDNVLTTVWMMATIAIPLAAQRLWRAAKADSQEGRLQNLTSAGDGPTDRPSTELQQAEETGRMADPLEFAEDQELLHPVDLGVLLALGAGSIYLSDVTHLWLIEEGMIVPSVVILTTLALVLAQLPVVQRTRGSQVLGMFAMYLFLAVIAAACDLAALWANGRMGLVLFALAGIVIMVHALFTFGAAALFRIDLATAAIASQANIGGATTALAVARSLNRRDLAAPGVLVGSLGYALGTYLGFFVARYLL
ncbi:DUF819 family protein [Lignipirellula cremea]|uniref:DUF819 family protein n=1 Tax=Lignipirellula cremea TaxID=2528010 RepID=A0A518DT43_9BACT|nr:DUF819 family protein [Lignipirellula cremea]QDU94993.1 hypothetical protein Pla8534_28020 [Lignipirellula cremea]